MSFKDDIYEYAKKGNSAAKVTVEVDQKVNLKNIEPLYCALAFAANSRSGGYMTLKGNKGCGKTQVDLAIEKYFLEQQIVTEVHKTTMSRLSFELYKFDNETGVTYFPLKKDILYVLTDIKEFLYILKTDTQDSGSAAVHTLKQLTRFQDHVYVMIVGEPDEIDAFMDYSEPAKFLYGESLIEIGDYTPSMLYDQWYAHLLPARKQRVKPTTKEWFVRCLASCDKMIPLKNQQLAEYLAHYTNKRYVNKGELSLPNAYEDKKKASLDGIVGMSAVKRMVEEFNDLIVFRKRAEKEGMNLQPMNLHMLFTGNPGTGKTTVARIIAGMLYDLGLIEKDKVVEVSAQDLLAEYTGQTASKTQRVVDSAMGSVLFIDEAYSLVVEGGSEAFGKEALAVIIKAMEDHKDNLVVILAGYKNEMENFVRVNPGLESRIGYRFQFDDYTSEELIDIYRMKMEKSGFRLAKGVIARARMCCEAAVKVENFGNGRFVDRLVDRTIMHHASNQAEDVEFNVIVKSDVPEVSEMLNMPVQE